MSDDTDQKSEKDVPMQVRVSPASKVLLDDLSAKHGVTQKAVVGRMITWFERQPVAVRNAMILPGGDVGAELLKVHLGDLFTAGPDKLAESVERLDVDQALAVAHAILDRVQQIHRATATQLVERVKAEK
ncbi:MAG TPA: hypothetical protein VF796_26810, partial [Humisphaera sp.]